MTGELVGARFPSVSPEAGHYESFYLKVSDPHRPRGAWIRYTVLKRPGQPPRGSVWCTLWPGDGVPPQAVKATVEEPGADELIRVGASHLGPGRATGELDGAGWQLNYRTEAGPFAYLPRPWMYRAPIPRTKAVSLSPRASFEGEVTIGEQTLRVDGWPGMIGHNWGAEHAERWIWIHGTGFEAAPEAWFDAILGRVRIGRVTVPWIGNGGLWLDGRLRRLGGPAALRATLVIETPGGCRFTLPGLSGQVQAPEVATVAWEYGDPAGGRHFARNCSVAALTLTVDGRSLRLAAGAAYELGGREPPVGIPVQPFPDP